MIMFSNFKQHKKCTVISLVLVPVILFAFILIGCKKSSEHNELKIPINYSIVNQEYISKYTLEKYPVKIIVWADSTGCTGCKLQLDTWQYTFRDLYEIFPNKIGYLFFLQFKEEEDMRFFLGIDDFDEEIEEAGEDEGYDDYFQYRFPQPVVWDPQGVFGKLNSRSGYVCFIVGKDNEILFEGEPPFTPSQRNKYVETIKKYIDSRK